MKTITLKVVVPKWARWKAKEQNGWLWVYQCEPHVVCDAFWFAERGRYERIAKTTPPKDFTKTLRRIK